MTENEKNSVPSHGSYEGTKLYELEQRVIALEIAINTLLGEEK